MPRQREIGVLGLADHIDDRAADAHDVERLVAHLASRQFRRAPEPTPSPARQLTPTRPHAEVASDEMADSPEHRLPRTAIPARYELTLEPDLVSSSFRGECTTEVEVIERTDEIVLNAAELEIDEAWLEGPGPERRRVAVEVRLDPEAERAHLLLASPVDPGGWFLTTRFRGLLNDQLRGFYRSSFTDDEDRPQLIATTQMEATHARRAFPCWDEPELKAVFATTLVVDPEHLAVANTCELGRSPTPDGRIAVQFADSMPMSTYLVAFVVGPLVATEPVEVGDVELRVICRPGREHLTAFALDVGRFALEHFETYYGIPYPGDKLDLVAIPDFAFGAMENMGCVTFREVLLLVDPTEVTQPELQNVVDVIAHELAHMWFGNLVTMKWWNGIWLNEAFATFMELRCTDAFRPDWNRWVAFGDSRAAAFDVDALASTRPIEYEVISPEDAEGMFDVLTYEKGAAVVRMLEQYLGEERFRAGIRHYLQRHQYANTETTDLWDAIEAATGEPARRIMDSWIFQGGFPLVHVEPIDGGLRLRQERFTYLPGGSSAGETSPRWAVPVLVRTGSDGSAVIQRVLLEQEEHDLELPSEVEWVQVNTGASGFYRVRYAPGLLGRLVDRAQDLLAPDERYGLADDAWAAVLAGQSPAASYLDLVEGFTDETDLAVWQRLLASLTALDRLVEDQARAALRGRVRDLLGPARDRLGAATSLTDRDRQLVASLFEASAILGADPDTRRAARDTWDRYAVDPAAVDPGMASAAISVLAAMGGAEEFDLFLGRFEAADTPQDELRFLGALADFDDPGLIGRLCELTLTDTIRTQNAPYVLRRAVTNRDQGAVAWDFVRQEWDRLVERFPSNSIVRMLEGIRALDRPGLAPTVFAFFEDHDVPQGRVQLEQHLERLRVNVALRQREARRLAEVLAP